MTVGVGIDIVDISRIERAMRRDGFVRRILTEREEAYCTTPFRVAGRWAAKEAILKAVGVQFRMQDIEILNDPLGQPHVTIRDPNFDLKRLKILISITHERTHAAAVAIVERSVLQVPLD
jgi:holo-[acyl-carrier protein] synthase